MNRLKAVSLGPLQGWGLWGSVLAILTYVVVSAVQYGQPYVIDEAVFPYVADGILKNGAPTFYNGETRPYDSGLWHPPLYDYLLAGHLAIWGVSSTAVRVFGTLCVIAAFWFLVLTLRRIAPTARDAAYVVLAWVFLLNPLVVSDALVPDIDGTLGVLVVGIGIWLATVVMQDEFSWKLAGGIAVYSTLAVSTKLTLAPFVALLVVVAAVLSTRARGRKVLGVIIAFAVGAAGAMGLLFAAGALLGFDATAPFQYLFGSLGSRTPGQRGLSGVIANFLVGPGSNAVWIGPAVFLSAMAVGVMACFSRRSGVDRRLVLLLLGFGLFIVIAYSVISASPYVFPKYVAIAVAALAPVVAAAVAFLPRGNRPAVDSRGRAGVSASLLVATFVIAAAGVFVILLRYEATHNRSILLLTILTVGAFFGATLVAALLLGAGRGLRGAVVFGLVTAVAVTPILVQTASTVVNAVSPFATRYYYRERGLSEFLERARELIPADGAVLSPKDVGLQLGRPFFEDAFFIPLDVDKLRTELDQLNAPYLVTRRLYDYSALAYPAQHVVLADYYEPILDDPTMDLILWKRIEQ